MIVRQRASTSHGASSRTRLTPALLVSLNALDAQHLGQVDEDRISRNPCASVKLPPENARPMRFLEPDQVVAVADATAPHYRAMILTAGFIGLRFGELAGLALDRVNLLRKSIRVERTLVEVAGKLSYGEPKTKAGARTVSIPGSLVTILADHFGGPAVRASGLAFPGPKGASLRRGGWQRIWRRACTEAGFDGGPLDRLHFHELRHTAVAIAIAQGAHPLAIMERLGHASITTTMDTYGGLFPSLDEALAKGLDEVLLESLAAYPRPGASESRAFGQVRGG